MKKCPNCKNRSMDLGFLKETYHNPTMFGYICMNCNFAVPSDFFKRIRVGKKKTRGNNG
jgi:hypothetical protein